jgi:DNA mismatch repair ATPase MutL
MELELELPARPKAAPSPAKAAAGKGSRGQGTSSRHPTLAFLAGHPTATVLDGSSSSTEAAAASPSLQQSESLDLGKMRAIYTALATARQAMVEEGGGEPPEVLSLFDAPCCDWEVDDAALEELSSSSSSKHGFIAKQLWGAAARAASRKASAASSSSSSSSSSSPDGLFDAPTGMDASAAEAESELTRVLGKASFLSLSHNVVGQFNNGFIIAGLQRGTAAGSAGGAPPPLCTSALDLFILDQHASDEKSRYEALRASTVIHTQRLLLPKPLQLSAGEESVVLEHTGVFEANGFHFRHTPGAPSGQRLALTAHPFSKGKAFHEGDVQELACLVGEATPRELAPGAPPLRLPRLNAMYASRACRSAIMIGRALRRDTMRRVVAHMAEMEQPWNCPHGRPTMRHLVDAAALRRQGRLAAGALVAGGGEGGRAPEAATQASPQQQQQQQRRR